jgi:ABC-2 type transport system ATP-binding protein
MNRRLNLGLSLMHRPPLLFLDEPTTGVDPQSRNHIFEHVRTLNAQGTTIIYTSLYLEEVQTLCRRIGILEAGRLIACDTLPALLQRLDGEIRVRFDSLPPGVEERAAALPGVRVERAGDDALRLVARDVPKALLGLVSVLNELKVEPASLETAEPNLERVFLHLTGHALRD